MPRWLLILAGLLSGAATGAAAEPVAVRIEGLAEALERNVRATLTIAREDGGGDPERIRYAHRQAPEEIEKALEPFGYYRPAVRASLDREGGNWLAVYRVEAGPPIRLREVDLRLLGEGADAAELRPLIERFPLKKGEILDHALYEKGRDALQNAAADLGFFDARFTRREIRVDLDAYTSEIILHFDTGKRYRLGGVTFSETPLQGELLQRFVEFRPGDPYHASELIKLQKDLFNSGYFAKADVNPEPENAEDGEVPVRVALGMQPRNRFQSGVGYGTDTGPRLTLGYRNRYLNRYGHSFQGTLRFSWLRNELDALYAIPLQHPQRDQLGFAAQLRTEDTEAGRADVARIGARRSTTRWGLGEVLSLDLHHETFNIDGRRTAFLVMPGVSYTWLESDKEVYPDRGIRLTLAANGASERVLSDATFLRLLLNAKGVYTLGERNRLVSRGTLGYIATEHFERIPLTQRFYAGGDQSVRGYRLNEISPFNAEGQRTGGRYLAVGSLEYDRTVYGPWGVAAFYDVGGAFNRFGKPFSQGVGLGVRWRSPVGPVRFDIGVPLSRALDAFQLHLILGPDL
jgi:translocation and assembly module TamA